MPNWCENYVTVSGTEEQIKRLAETQFDFNDIVPEPVWNDSNNDRWYDWRLEHWGCKWNVDKDEIGFDSEGTEGSARMNTPWCPPIKIYDALVNRGMVVQALYFEPNCQISGMYRDGRNLGVDIFGCIEKCGSYKTFFAKDPLGQTFEKYFNASQYFDDDEDMQ